MLEKLDTIPWKKLGTAYGNASEAPQAIRDLLSVDEDVWLEAVCGFLFSYAVHQGTIYSCTPHVIPFIIEILDQSPHVRTTTDLRRYLLEFLAVVARYRQKRPDIDALLRNGIPIYKQFEDDPDQKIHEYVQKLLENQ